MMRTGNVLCAVVVLLLIASAVMGEGSGMNTNIKHVSGKVWIDGVDRLQWGIGQENTFIGALTAAMRAIGEDVNYDYLMGVSGAAFRVQIYRLDWCPSAPDATCGFDCSGPAMEALGYKPIWMWASADKPDEMKKVREAVVESIDKGKPAVAIDLVNVPDWGVIIGYADGGKDFLCKSYYDKAARPALALKWPWAIMLIGEKGVAPDRKQSLIKSLEIAEMLAVTENFDKYASGFNAYETWAKGLLDDSRFKKLTKEDLSSVTHTNAWCYVSLIDARSAAAKYLRAISSEFSSDGAKHISKAADIYEQITNKLSDGLKYVPFTWELKEDKRWTAEMRHSEAALLKDALTLEKTAITELKAALASERK